MINDRIGIVVPLIDRHQPGCRQQGVGHIPQLRHPSAHEFTRRIVVEVLLHRVIEAQGIHARDS